MKRFAFWTMLLSIWCVAARAQELIRPPAEKAAAAAAAAFSPEIKRIAVFKNGYAFTYREGEARIGTGGWAYTTRTPIGVLGTVWGYSAAPNVRVEQLLASQEEADPAAASERVTNVA